jgi:hypothetical protein
MASVSKTLGHAGAALAAALLAVQPLGALAAPVVSTGALADATKTVAGFTVFAPVKCLKADRGSESGAPPRVVSSFPRPGAVVRPGLLVVRLTFSRPMACEGSFGSDAQRPNPCPGSARQMLMSADRKTIRAICDVAPGTRYSALVNKDTAPSFPFLGVTGGPSTPYELNFTTSTGAPIAQVCEALLEDAETAGQIADCADAHANGG